VYNWVEPFVTTDALARNGFLGDGMEKPAQNIQDSFLNNARKDKVVLTIYLMSGVKLSGRIKSFDKYSLVLETNNQEQLIFKHAISTVVTQKSAHSYSTGPSSTGPSTTAHSAAAGAPSTPVHADATEA
jgi:host factor-I protein